MKDKAVATTKKKPAVKPAKKAAIKKPAYATFRYYGYKPAECHSGPYVFEICFKTPLTPEQRAALARSFERSMADTAIDVTRAHSKWRWSGPWAAFRIDVAEGCDLQQALEDMHPFLHATGTIMRVEEVIFHGVKTPGTDEWEAWSIAKQAVPSDAPSWPDLDLGPSYFGAEQKRFAAESAIDPAFEAARLEARPVRQVVLPGQPALIRVKDREPSAAVPAADQALLPSGFHVKLLHAGGRTWAGIKVAHDGDIAWLDGGKVTQVHVPGYDTFSISDDGSRALVVSHDEVREIIAPSTKLPKPISSSGDEATIGAWYAANNTIAMLSPSALVLFGRQDGKLVERDRVTIANYSSLGVFRGGTIAVITCGGGFHKQNEYPVRVFRIADDKLSEAATFTHDGIESFSIDGKIYVQTQKHLCELVNI